jgi:hypothetical protein
MMGDNAAHPAGGGRANAEVAPGSERSRRMKSGGSNAWGPAAAVLIALCGGAQGAGSTVVYRCPGNPVLYTDTISAKEAKDKGCKMLEGAPVTVIQGPRPRTAAVASSGPAGSRVDPAAQRERDNDARRILEGELRREEDRLAAMKTEYNGGQPERLGNERNYQKYLDRVAEMKAAIERKESDIAALKREIAKQPQ